MTPQEMEMLMSMVFIGDRRTTGKYDVGYWAMMAQQGRWTLPTAMRALVIYRSEHPGEWIDPGHLTSIIRDARRQASATFVVPKEPDGIKGADLPKWHRAQLAAHQDRLLAKWAGGEDLPVTTDAAAEITGGPKQLTSGLNLTTCPEELLDQVKRDFERAGRERADRRRLPTRIRTFVGDPEQRARAMAELEAKRAEMGEQEAS